MYYSKDGGRLIHHSFVKFIPEISYLRGMKAMISRLYADKKLFLWNAIYLICIAMVMNIQNYIRYSIHYTYNPWITVFFTSIGVLLFFIFLPGVYVITHFIKSIFERQFWVLFILVVVLSILFFYAFSSIVMYLTGEYAIPFHEKYARFYFGRVVVFHIFSVLSIGLYIFLKKPSKTSSKQISGTQGRKKISIQVSLVEWIEADDHYLKIFFQGNYMVKRSTLEQMTKELAPEFIRIHRKYLVNKSQIVGKEKVKRDEFLILKNGERLKIGRSYLPLELEKEV